MRVHILGMACVLAMGSACGPAKERKSCFSNDECDGGDICSEQECVECVDDRGCDDDEFCDDGDCSDIEGEG